MDRLLFLGLGPGNPDAEPESVRAHSCVIAVVDVLPQASQRDLESIVRLRQQDAKLIAAGSGKEVRLAKRRRQDLSELHERLVARRVAKRVVDPLEPVEVDQQDLNRPFLAPRDFANVRREGREATSVVEARERVDQRQLSRFLLSPCSDDDLPLKLFITAPGDLHRALSALEKLEGAEHAADEGGKVSR